MKENSLFVIQFLLDYLHVKVTKTSIVEELEKHPNDLSLLAISDTLNHWHVANAAYKLSDVGLATLPVPFIAHLSSHGGEFVWVEKFDDRLVTVSNDHFRRQEINKEEFAQAFTGNVLIAKASEGAGENNYRKRRLNEMIGEMRIPFIVSGLVVVFLLTVWLHTFSASMPSWRDVVLMLIKASGVATSILLLIHSVDSQNPFIQRLCTGGNGRNCNSILSSKAAKVTSSLSWSEVGFFYFSGSLLGMLLGGSQVIPFLAVINLVCLPYTVYSLWYQFRIVKQWCPLCCAVQALLWMEFVAFFPYLYSGGTFLRPPVVITLLISFSLPAMFWFMVRPWIIKSEQVKSMKRQLKKFKYNNELFRMLLQEEDKHEMPDDGNYVVLGNPEAGQVITIVSNPYCQPCSRAHIALEACLTGREDLQLQVIFSTAEGDKNGRIKVAAHMMALYKKDLEVVKQAMDDWYGQKRKNYEEWAKHYPVGIGQDMYESLGYQRQWCNKVDIKGTPTILINGHRLPDIYSPEDIRYLI